MVFQACMSMFSSNHSVNQKKHLCGRSCIENTTNKAAFGRHLISRVIFVPFVPQNAFLDFEILFWFFKFFVAFSLNDQAFPHFMK